MLLNPYRFGGGGGGPATDPYWASVKLLLEFDGADGSTTFTDLSPTPCTVTPSGGAQINGGQLLLTPTNSGSRLSTNRQATVGAGQFTLEAYITPNVNQYGRIISAQDSITPNAALCLRVDTGGSLTGLLRSNAGTGLVVVTSATGIVAMNGTAQYHVALTRNASNVVTIWLNGTSVATGGSSTDPNGGRNWFIGAFDNTQERFPGKIDGVRITEGVCRYTAAFTPPTLPYPHS